MGPGTLENQREARAVVDFPSPLFVLTIMTYKQSQTFAVVQGGGGGGGRSDGTALGFLYVTTSRKNLTFKTCDVIYMGCGAVGCKIIKC